MSNQLATVVIDPIALSPAEAAKALDVSERHIYRLCDAGEVESHYLGRLRRVSYSSLQAYYDRMPTHRARD